MFRNLWAYRYFILSSIRGEFKGRFARSSLGGLWFVLHPLAQALIFSVVLAEVLQARLPRTDVPGAFPIYLLSGMAAWGLFSEILTRSMTVFIDQAPVMKKIAFPRLCLPIILGGTALINHGLLLAAIFVVFAFFGHVPGKTLILLPLGLFLITALAFGLGVILGVMNVFMRDVAQVVSIILQLWFWITPIVYPKEVVPSRFQDILMINPMAPLVALYQDALLLDRWTPVETLIYPSMLALATVAVAILFFRRASPELVDVL
ncbi:lipopolysaccharide transport system permease protein [Bradyrhizobium sp. USDA 4532]|uniref:ABC transporter permease n=1 Tax=unclassified Bradyrhizobium TaxID=2631580 RepID=UPI00209EC202|nr:MULTISPECIES: ABC transporter permease [unclassified Bradyrhizobium]MCP1831683.1 lipopolysaccharide transport system permease protein [Bradyrhizobium sp. USDA 4545]MCP1916520.1 lipopolysaccharide transport system permease protein [Bradyrhizobium sp. USDA 4532]